MGVTDSIFASVTYSFAALIFTGMVVLAYQLSYEWLGAEAYRSIEYFKGSLKDRFATPKNE